jgi:hypothetical protein
MSFAEDDWCRNQIIIDPDNLPAEMVEAGIDPLRFSGKWVGDDTKPLTPAQAVRAILRAALSAALHIDRPESPLAEASRLVSEQQDALHIDQETG